MASAARGRATVRAILRDVPFASCAQRYAQPCDAIVIEAVRVEWPSGAVQELRNTAANQTLTVTEPPRLAASPRADGVGFEMNLTGAAGVAYEIEESPDLANWMPIATLTNSSRATPFTDAAATAYRQRFYRAHQLGASPNAAP